MKKSTKTQAPGFNVWQGYVDTASANYLFDSRRICNRSDHFEYGIAQLFVRATFSAQLSYPQYANLSELWNFHPVKEC